MEHLDFDLDDIDFDFDFEIKSSAEEFLQDMQENDEEEMDEQSEFINNMKTRVSTDPIIELV
jgi:hypothetical protein